MHVLGAAQVVQYYSSKVSNIKADLPQDNVAEQIRKAVAKN